MKMDAHMPLAGRLRAAWEARQLVRHVLGEHHPAVDDAVVVASELATNAVVHTRSGEPGGSLTVSVGTSLQPPAVCISVRDEGAADGPVIAREDRESEHGRGLAIVTVLAAEWGTEPRGQGRVTWCRLTPGPSGPGASDAWPRTFWPDLDERPASGAELEAEP